MRKKNNEGFKTPNTSLSILIRRYLSLGMNGSEQETGVQRQDEINRRNQNENWVIPSNVNVWNSIVLWNLWCAPGNNHWRFYKKLNIVSFDFCNPWISAWLDDLRNGNLSLMFIATIINCVADFFLFLPLTLYGSHFKGEMYTWKSKRLHGKPTIKPLKCKKNQNRMVQITKVLFPKNTPGALSTVGRKTNLIHSTLCIR